MPPMSATEQIDMAVQALPSPVKRYLAYGEKLNDSTLTVQERHDYKMVRQDIFFSMPDEEKIKMVEFIELRDNLLKDEAKRK